MYYTSAHEREDYVFAHTNRREEAEWRTLTAASVLESLVVGICENGQIMVAAQKWSLVGWSIHIYKLVYE